MGRIIMPDTPSLESLIINGATIRWRGTGLINHLGAPVLKALALKGLNIGTFGRSVAAREPAVCTATDRANQSS
ncbi:MAG TPA: hypothetical protein DGG94_14275 [Micromonosporaceae bacterium]|nr:hypothetical protein [Micromonosporaceae bacterium]HCU50942.1 hypothetical protein [Micromonosporaceae bacterium]